MKTLHDIEHINWELLAKYLCEEASDSERQEVEAWAGQSGTNPANLKKSRELMQKATLWYETGHFDKEAAWNNIRGRIDTSAPVIRMQRSPEKRIFLPRLMRVAASLLLAVTLGTAGYFIGFRQHKPAVYTEVITNDRQVVAGITLPDGSVVTLNRNSALTYPRTFSGNIREVSITGEAFFEVSPDAERPFVIQAGSARIRVLGTSFNVCAYPEAESVDVIVATGKVQVTCKDKPETNGCKLILTPGERGTLSNKDLTLVKSANSDQNASAWKTKQLVFEDTPLAEVVSALEKVYFVNIQLADPALRDLALTANFNNQPVDFILDVIRLTFNLELTSMNGQYYFTHRKTS